MKNILALSFLLLALSFLGCGYKPSTEYTTPILGKTIDTKVEIDIKNPEDAIFLKDALNEAVLAVFNSKVEKNGDSKIELKILSTHLSALDYDKNGYPILYRASVSIKAYVTDVKNNLNSYTGSGSYDFSISSDSVLSDNLKHNAIKEAFLKALQVIEFKIAQRGMDDNKGY